MHKLQQLARLTAIPLISALVLTTGCKKDAKPDPEPGPPSGALTEIPADMKVLVTPKPQPAGTKVSKVIGPAGGTLSSEDGDIAIVVPAGAVAATTTFSIQPVENTLQANATSKTSYELLPHNVTFSKPVTIIMNYDMDAYEQTADGLQVASRDEATGQWALLPTTLDKEEGTLTVEKTSFSIFEFFERYVINVASDYVKPGEKAFIQVGGLISYQPPTPSADELALVPLIPGPEFENQGSWYQVVTSPKPKIDNWRVLEGGGTVKATSSKHTAQYTAPDPVTSDFALVEVTLSDLPPIKDSRAPGGVRNGGELKLIGHVNLMHAWLKVNVGAAEYFLKAEVTGGVAGSKTFGVGGETEIPGLGKVVAFAAVVLGDGTRATEGAYPFGVGYPGGAVAGVDVFDQGWSSAYYDCDSHTSKPASGKVTFYEWGTTPGSIIRGYTSFTAYRMVSVCDKVTESVTIEWYIPID